MFPLPSTARWSFRQPVSFTPSPYFADAHSPRRETGGGVIGGVGLQLHQREQRIQHSFSLSKGKPEHEPQRQCCLDDRIGVASLTAWFQRGYRGPRLDRLGRKADRDVASPGHSLPVQHPIPRLLLRLIIRMHFRLLGRQHGVSASLFYLGYRSPSRNMPSAEPCTNTPPDTV